MEDMCDGASDEQCYVFITVNDVLTQLSKLLLYE